MTIDFKCDSRCVSKSWSRVYQLQSIGLKYVSVAGAAHGNSI